MAKPISKQEYKSKTESFWKGKKVASLVPIANGLGELPAGSVFSVTRKFKGFSLTSEPCKCCGVSLRVTYVACWKLTLVLEINPDERR